MTLSAPHADGERSCPVRVAHIMGKMLGGGVEAVVMNYYRHIDRERVQFDFIVDSDSTLVPRNEIERLGGRVFEVPPYQKLPAYTKALRELFNREGWRIVHSHINTLSVFPLGVAKRVGVSVRIAHSHSTSGKGEHAKNAVKSLLKLQANRYPTHRLACSEYAGRWLFGADADFTVMRNAIELDEFAFDSSLRAQVRSELGLVESQRVIGHVGRFTTQKNHTFLIDVFAELAMRRDDAVLVLVGSGELRSFVECRAAERRVANKVIFLGQRNDVARLYQAFDAFVLPSLYEGLGLVGVEAQATGLPCVFSSAITREVALVRNCEFLAIDQGDIASWVDALEAAIDAPRPVVDASSFAAYDIHRAACALERFYRRAHDSAEASFDTGVSKYIGG